MKAINNKKKHTLGCAALFSVDNLLNELLVFLSNSGFLLNEEFVVELFIMLRLMVLVWFVDTCFASGIL